MAVGVGDLTLGETRALLAAALRERLPELERVVATRVRAIADPAAVGDPAYVQGLEAALPAMVARSLATLELGERRDPEPPPVLLAQARLDARDAVPLDTVMRRYFAVNALFGDFLVEEAERAEVPSAALRRVLGAQATAFDRLLGAVGDEYAREARSRPTSAAERRRKCVKALLCGELVDTAELGYDLDGEHLGLMAKGEGAREAMGELAARLDRRLLAVRREEEEIWGCWLGGRRPLAAEEAEAGLAGLVPAGATITIGEPAAGLAGWRASHLQSKAALALAERRELRVLRYAEVALLAAILADELTVASLRQVYLEPLEAGRDGGLVARTTLRAYFAAERNVSATAAALGVDRRTVRNRIVAIEERLGRSLREVGADLEIALRLDD